VKRVGLIQGIRIDHREDWFPSLQGHVYEQDDFLGDILRDEWAINAAGPCGVAIAAGQSGLVVLTTDITNDNWASLAKELNYSAALYAGIEARVKIDDKTGIQIEVGLVDAKSYANGRAFTDFDQTGGLPTPIAADAAIIGYDPTDSITAPFAFLTGVSVDSGGVAAAVDLGVDLTNLTFVILKIQIDALGTARYYVNNNLLGTQLLAIEPATPLTPWMTLSNKAGNIRNLTVDYCKSWQRRV